MEELRYTKFPDLSFPFREENPNDIFYSWDVNLNVSEEALILSWASLLRSYTGNEKPIFVVATNDVEVDLLEQTISKVKAASSATRNCEWTGISLHRVSSRFFQKYAAKLFAVKVSRTRRSMLYLQCDAEPGRYSLESYGYVPYAHLKQIAHQLEQIWTTRLGHSFHGKDMILSTTNLKPRMLEGPKLLHKLPRFRLGDRSLAVEFLSSDGSLCSYSYSSIDQLSTTLASRLRCVLRASGGLKRQIIPVLIPQAPELYIALLAILKAGAAFCPLNLDTPEERIKFIVRDVSASVIVTIRNLEKRFAWTDGHVIVAVDEGENGCDGGELAHFPEPEPTDLAYVMYTSGSTGSPKGVPVSHFAATQSLLAHDRHIPLFNRFLQFAAPTFDVFVFEMFFPLFRGSTLVGCSKDKLLDDLPGVINRLRIDAAELTPSVAGGLLRRRNGSPGLQVLLTIGETLTSPVVNEFGGSSTVRGILHGMYGPTEAAIHCTIAPNFQACSRIGIIGVPLDTVSALIIAPQTYTDTVVDSVEILPIGQVGELAIGGYQLADGYLNLPEQTSHSFIETRQYGRLYRTGDRARLLTGGCLEFLGRVSSGQVKLRGQRVELGEIEQVACRTDGISNSVARVIGGVLVVFCSVSVGWVTVKHVLDNCSQWLPRFMVPADIILVRDLPRLPSGKIDRHRLDSDYLKAREGTLSSLNDAANETEQKISDAVCNLIGVAADRSASLAAAGLDSLLAIRLSSQLRMLGFSVGAAKILKADTIEGIGQIIDKLLELSGDSAGVDGQGTFEAIHDLGFTRLRDFSSAAGASEIAPCTPLQTAMLAETAKDAQAYCNWIELEVHSAIRSDDIKAAFEQLALQNEILRSGFIELEGAHSFCQVIWKDLPETCFSDVSKFDYNYVLGDRLALLRPLRIQIREGNNGFRVLVQIHHALYDGWSWEHVMDDLECILAGQKTQSRPAYRKLVEFYLRPSTDSDLAISREFWEMILHDAPLCMLPSLNGHTAANTPPSTTRLQMSFQRVELESVSRKFLVSPQAFFQGAFAYILSSYLGQSDVVFGVVLSGRTLPIDQIEDIIGPCLATVPFRLNVSSSRTVRDLVQSAHKQGREILEHCALPLRDIRQACGVRPGEVLFDTLLIYQQTLKQNFTESHLISQVNGVDYLEFNLTVEVEPGPDRVYVKANYKQAIIPEGQINALLSQLDQLVTAFIRSDLMSLNECRTCFTDSVLSIENPNPRRRLGHATLPNCVERAAQECPEDLAVEFHYSINDHSVDPECLSYRELNIRANQVAHCLISSNVLPDELVCVYMDKGIDLYISTLAVAKAGAGYLPLSPDTPKHRIIRILKEARVRQCLTHSLLWRTLNAPEGVSGICLDEYDFRRLPVSNPTVGYQPSNLAYAVFTPGSTGTPKGVLVTQENLLSHLEVLGDIYPVEKGSRLLQSCSQASDVSISEIYFAWYSKMCLCSATNGVLFHDIEAAVRNMRISHLSLTPTVAALVDSKNVPRVRFLVTAGEALSQKCRGYINMPELTSKRFIDHPTFGRLYRSGDYGRLHPDGSLQFMGRQNDQVKIRGQRVELGEIDNIMLKSPIVLDCTTLLVTNVNTKSRQSVCFWVPKTMASGDFKVLSSDPDIRFAVNQLYDILAPSVPIYMVPSFLVPLSCLPMTDQGKTDKMRLIAVFQSFNTHNLESFSHQSRLPGQDDHLTGLGREVAQAVADIVNVPVTNIRPSTSFFSLGLDSISAISLSRVLRSNGHSQLEASLILRHPTVSGLCNEISQGPSPEKRKGRKPIVGNVFGEAWLSQMAKRTERAGREVQKVLPCTPLQEAMLSKSNSSNGVPYCNHTVFEIYGDLDRLKDCWDEMASRHEILRTCFLETDNPHHTFAQVVLKQHRPVWSSAETSTLEAGSELKDYIPTIKLQFNELEPPYHFTSIRSPHRTALLLLIHHALYDAVAMSQLLEEVQQSYLGISLPTVVPFESYLEHVVSVDLGEAKQFWEVTLKGFRPSPFPEITELIESLQKANTDSLPYQLTPLRYIQSTLSGNGQRVFDTVFILQQPQQNLDDEIWSILDDTGDMEASCTLGRLCGKADSVISFLSSANVADFGFLGERLLSVANEQSATLGAPNSLLHLGFERNARERPLIIALDFLYPSGERVIWTFEKLNNTSDRIARVLRENSVNGGEIVLIYMDKSPLFYASILGVLKAGATFTPIDPQSPVNHKNSVVKELQARILLSDSTVDTSWCALKVIILDEELPYTKPKDGPPIREFSHSSLAYQIYASGMSTVGLQGYILTRAVGSAGEPKPVSIEHQSAVQTIEYLKDILPWTTETRLLQYAAIDLHMCYFDCFVAWSFGFCLCSAAQSSLLNDLASTINNIGVNMLHLTPTVASSLSKSSVPSVQYIHCTGEGIPQRLSEDWANKLINSYGSIEAGMCCTAYFITPEVKPTVIGSPLPHTSFTVLSNDIGYPVPRLGVGELCIGGSQVARNYQAGHGIPRSQYTHSAAGEVLYRSGDLVRMLGNGLFECIGRTGDWNRMGGTRVELDEINYALQTGHSDITNVATMVVRTPERPDERLVSFLAVLRSGNCDLEGDFATNIKNAARLAALKKLPAYMVPRTLIPINGIPLSPNGKADKQGLASLFRQWQATNLYGENEDGDESLLQPDLDEDERELCNVFSRYSGTDRKNIQRETTIYQLGLDSINAIQIASELRRRGSTVSAADILQRPSIGQLILFLRESRRDTCPQQPMFGFAAFEQINRKIIVSQLGISNVELQSIRPCTPIQAGMIAQFLNSGGSLYFNHLVMRTSRGVDVTKICEAWEAAMGKHDMLRTGFAEIDHKEHQFAMLTYRSEAVGLPLYHLGEISDIQDSLTIQRRACASGVFQSLHRPAWRLGVIQGEGETSIQFSAHHALYDAQSLQYIFRDVSEAYRGALNASVSSLNETLGAILCASRESEEQKLFWQGIGKELLISKFPSTTPLRVESKATRVVSRICSKTRHELEANCGVHGLTMQAIGEAAWARVLAAYTGNFSVTFGLATVPVSLRMQKSNKDLFKHIMEVNSSLLKYQFTSLSNIQQWTGHAGKELFDTIFVYQKLSNNDGRHEDLWELLEEEATAGYTISIELEPFGDSNLNFKITFREDKLPVEQARLLLRQLDATMNDSLEHPEAQALDMSRLPKELLSISPAKEQYIPSEVNLMHQFVEVQRGNSPKKPALEFATNLHNGEVLKTIWTYEELDAEGNRIANVLTHSGALPADLIAICFDKCPEASFAILGILKAGCAFVALDSNAPIARKLFIVKDSRSKCLLTTEQHASELQQQLNIPVISLDNKSYINGFLVHPPALQREIKPNDVCYCLYTSGRLLMSI
ncbi:NRPS protein [Trichoglossum hirsutum]|uniref:NRPS protein n=1 Tax=Trichoglossum hirsutum TaxID=265104 RepID=A0A9P8RSR7_9PEZI|nr:NRPS protein [Trichoglossum hirsutum]